MNRLDNVATLLDDLEKNEIVSCKGLTDIVELKANEKCHAATRFRSLRFPRARPS